MIRATAAQGRSIRSAMGSKATIKHIEFWVSDFEGSLEFYKGIFKIIGWNWIEENAFSNGEIKIYFIEQPGIKSQNSAGPRHICFLANSHRIVDDLAQFLLKNNGNIIRGPLKSQYKDRSYYTVDFKDPDGYIIEVATKSVKLKK